MESLGAELFGQLYADRLYLESHPNLTCVCGLFPAIALLSEENPYEHIDRTFGYLSFFYSLHFHTIIFVLTGLWI